MSLIQEVDIRAYFAHRRASTRTAELVASLPDATGFSGMEPSRAAAVRSFAEDYTREHSSSIAHPGSVSILAEPEVERPKEMAEDRQL